MSSMGSNRIVPLQVLRTLERYASEGKPLSNLQIIARIQQDERVRLARNTVAAAVSTLEAMGYVERTQKGSYAVRLFDETELRVLIDGVMASKYLPPVDAKYLIGKLMELGGESFSKRVQHVHMADEWIHQENVEFLRNIEIFEDAIEQVRQTSFYRNLVQPDGTLQRTGGLHRVSPYGIICTNGQYYLVCCKAGEQMLRHYRIDRLTDAALLAEPAEDVRRLPGYRHGFHLAEYAASHSMMFSGAPELIVLRLPETLAGYVRDTFGKQAQMRQVEGGAVEVRIMSTPQNVRFFALQYGPSGCEVLRPESLRRQLGEDAAALAGLYRQTGAEHGKEQRA